MKDIVEDVMLEDLVEELPKPILIEDLGMIYATEKSKSKYRFGIYKCGFCGNNFKALVHHIKGGHTQSCGCLNRKHNLSHTKIYKIWSDIKSRTLNPQHKQYNDYGGRGITICDEWLDVQNFYNWAMENGYSDELSIDRINNDGNYEPSNCRWTTQTIQNRNQRIQKNNKTGYKGVSFVKSKNKYTTYICVNKKNKCLGYFSTAEDGAVAYNNYILENNLEGFILNEIPERYKND